MILLDAEMADESEYAVATMGRSEVKLSQQYEPIYNDHLCGSQWGY